MIFRNRPVNLSITHIAGQTETEMDVRQPRDAAPEDHVAWRCVSGSAKIAAQLCETNQEVTHCFPFRAFFHWNEMFKQFDLGFREYEAGWQVR